MNTWQQPVSGEPSLGTGHKVDDPTVGWFASKTSGWTADSFSAGWTVDFSSIVPVGTKAILLTIYNLTAGGNIWTRRGGNTNISNTPDTSTEYANLLCRPLSTLEWHQIKVWLNSAYEADFAVSNVNIDLYLSYPAEYIL